jgi:hypothetical protein
VTFRAAAPYPGLVPYSEGDQELFFGRERETALVVDNMMASRFTLLYGASGVGKSSILRAGVMSALRKRAGRHGSRGEPPEFVPVIFQEWSDDPVRGLLDAVRTAVSVSAPEARLSARTDATLDESFAQVIDEVGELLLILDQFETYLLLHGGEDGPGTLAAELPRMLQRAELPVSVLLSIREEALGGLDRFRGRIPQLFEHYLRIEHLDRDAARAAIEGPISHVNPNELGAAVSIEAGLAEAVLDQTQTGRIVLNADGMLDPGGGGGRFEAAYLQVVMQRIWEEERAQGSSTLRYETLERLGGARAIVSRHLEEAVAPLTEPERATAAAVFRFLVTPAGATLALTVPDLAEFTDKPVAEVRAVVERLAGREHRILRLASASQGSAEPRYQIFHDLLAAPIQAWRRTYEVQRAMEANVRPTGWRRFWFLRRQPMRRRA